jgi:hypothetical protein
VRELLLEEVETALPEEVSYLFRKQLEESDIIVLNKVDLLGEPEKERLLSALKEKCPGKQVVAVSAREGLGMDSWLEDLLSGRPGANTVLRQIDYDRYAAAEAVLGWLNGAFALKAQEPFDVEQLALHLATVLMETFRSRKSEIGHLKFLVTSGGKTMWANLTHLAGEPALSGKPIGQISKGSLILNARVRLEPEELERVVKETLRDVLEQARIDHEVLDLQCFSPAYPQPPYLIRDTAG